MSWSAQSPTSFLATSTFFAGLTGTSYNLTTDVQKLALYTNTVNPTPDTASQAYTAAPWNANEVTGTNWAAGGKTLAGTTLSNTSGQGGMLSYQANNLSYPAVTLTTAARGCMIYDTTVGGSTSIVAIYFGGDFQSTAGTFAITWGSANGVTTLVWWILM